MKTGKNVKALTEHYHVQGILPMDAVGDHDYTPYYLAHAKFEKLCNEVIQAHWLIYKQKHMNDHQCEEMEGFMEYMENLDQGYICLASGPCREILVDRDSEEKIDWINREAGNYRCLICGYQFFDGKPAAHLKEHNKDGEKKEG